MGLSNNRLYPAQKVQKNTQNVHGEGDDQPWDFGGDPMSDKPWQTYVWHWSLQFSRENSLSHILVFMWYSSPFWCRKRLSNSLGLSVFKTYLVHSDSWFQINRKKNNWLVQKSPLCWFLRSVLPMAVWLYWNPYWALISCPKTPNPAGQIHMCWLGWLLWKKNRSLLLILTEEKISAWGPRILLMMFTGIWCFFCWLKPSIFCSLALPEGWCYEKGPGYACQKLHNHH